MEAAGPAVTVTPSVFEVAEPPVSVALAVRLTSPAASPVTLSWAVPLFADTALSPVTEPTVPVVVAKVTLRLLSVPEVTVFPAASSMVAVRVSLLPDARAEPPERTILVAGPNAVVPLVLNALVVVQESYVAVILYS